MTPFLSPLSLILSCVASFLFGALFTWLLMRSGQVLKDSMMQVTDKQSQLEGQLKSLIDNFQQQQLSLDQRLQGDFSNLQRNLAQNLNQQQQNQFERLTGLTKRLAIIDEAQRHIQGLAQEMVQLQHILSDKQTRGAFGQGRMEALVADALPKSRYHFQATLSNNKRPDCIIHLPQSRLLTIDAKFPLAAWEGLEQATRQQAGNLPQVSPSQFKSNMRKHIEVVSTSYIIPGETYELALLFVPSESIFATIHEKYTDIVQYGYQRSVMLVSPSLLLLAIQVIQSMFKDAQMNEQAKLIQLEVGKMCTDVQRLTERVQKLANHFNQSQRDVDAILTSTDKITRTGHKIKQVELEKNFDNTETTLGLTNEPLLQPLMPSSDPLRLQNEDAIL